MLAQVGGGDQLYSDRVWDRPSCQEYLKVCPVTERVKLPMSEKLVEEVERFYFHNYCQHFSEPIFADALATIPYVSQVPCVHSRVL